MTEINDKLANLKKSLGTSEKKVVDTNIDSLKKIDKSKQVGKGGKREGSGRKPTEQTLIKKGIKQIVDTHANEEVEVLITDRATKKVIKVKKPRVLIVMEYLYKIGTGENNVGALKEWLDRSMGKAPQPLKGDENDDTPIRIGLDITSVLDKGYKDEDDD